METNAATNLLFNLIKNKMEPHIVAQLDYLLEQVKVLKNQVKHLKLTDLERSRLAELGKKLKDCNQELFEQTTKIVKPKTVLEWHRKHVARKFNHSTFERRTAALKRLRRSKTSSSKSPKKPMKASPRFMEGLKHLISRSP